VRQISFFFLTTAMMGLLAGCGAKPSAETEKAKTEAPPAPVPEIPKDTRPVLLCFGNSLTAGYGLESGQAFPEVLQRLLDQNGYQYRVVNAGLSGDTTTGGVARLPMVMREQPKIALLELGGNDGLRGIDAQRTRDNLMQMVSVMQNRGAKVVLIGITLPRNYGREYIATFEKNYKMIASSKNLPLMPFLLEGVWNKPGMMQEDKIHPTAKGAELVAQNVFQFIRPHLSK
jgi:acyl-CoA thioesterase-1